ncbi:MAG: SDR family NAD(P)-dependent oxidoreductase [Chlamydiia bacterium]
MANPKQPPPGAVLITGAARGLGRSLAIGLAQQGWPLWLHHAQTPIDSLLDEIPAERVRGVFRGDLRDPAQCDELVRAVTEQGEPLYAIVHNAARYDRISLQETTPELFRDLLALNLEAPLQITRGCIERLQATKGVVLHLTHPGVTTPRADPASPAYSVTKSALHQLTRCLALELAPKGVRVHSMAPGICEHDEKGESSLPFPPRGHPMETSELLELVTWLLQPGCPSLTGGSFELGGGLRV